MVKISDENGLRVVDVWSKLCDLVTKEHKGFYKIKIAGDSDNDYYYIQKMIIDDTEKVIKFE